MRLFLYFSLLFFSISTTAQTLISGSITDENGEALPFATVYQKNSTNGTTANSEGQYELRLPSGQQVIVFQYIGYETLQKTVEIGQKPLQLDVQMQPASTTLGEVVIDANAEDPAYAIMREAIARRKEHREEIGDFKSTAYVKGMQKLLDAPDKVLGQEVGNMGGILDTTKQGIIYLSESVSHIYHQKNPSRSKEIMVSSKVSGEPNGFSLNRANIVDLDFYSEKIDVEREILTPLADNAFAYYRFKLRGRNTDETGRETAKIEVLPKRSNDPVFGGFLFIETKNYHIQAVQLHLTGNNIHQPVLDTLWIEQQFVPLSERPERWAKLSQNLSFKFGIFGFKIHGYFNAVFSDYDLAPDFSSIKFGKESFLVEEGANERDSSYWAALRPVPLTKEETFDYVRKDSLRIVWDSKPFRDSMDRVSNKFDVGDLLFGYTFSRSYKHRYMGFKSPLNTLLFNAVQGWNFSVDGFFNQHADKESTSLWYIEPSVSYGFSDKKIRGSLLWGKRFNRTNFDRFEAKIGRELRQFDPSDPISPFFNSFYSLLGKRNYWKAYEADFGKMSYEGRYKSGFAQTISVEYARRRPVFNTTEKSWNNNENRSYTANNPLDPTAYDSPAFQTHNAMFLNLNLRYRFGQEYMTYPKERYYYDEGKPEVYLRYRKGISFEKSEKPVDFDYLALGFEQDYLNVGIGGYMEWNVQGGTFLNRSAVPFMDARHFQGNQIEVLKSDRYLYGFFQLPYYALSTTEAFAEAHWQYHLQGFLLDKIPFLRKANLNEVLGANFLYTRQNTLFNGQPRPDMPYWEINAGLENLGIKAFRLLRFDVVGSFYGKTFERVGVVVGLGI